MQASETMAVRSTTSTVCREMLRGKGTEQLESNSPCVEVPPSTASHSSPLLDASAGQTMRAEAQDKGSLNHPLTLTARVP